MSAILLIAGLIAGKIALSSLGVAEIATLAQAGFSVAKVAVVISRDLDRKFPGGPGHVVPVIQGGPGGWGRAPVHFRWVPNG